ncbi:bifunctional 2-polyprenyl-6-hydroxyphenol methylase/3-demethylubiquinol 3-O-methyltransferase UbiG [Paenibacillus sp. NEAU-GSW1]|uniref:class I SAM-dependent methyltransferase n=1 Tax=Paenibacillus sp. NEAU-GSW1 TaxID=2682486 RepID=UPI0012E2012D|nr:class I SAM-dependent methyltransferase [Paenibacillus sp. NEAU-GSW1]MUT65168.1 methyltransferase domain-containing protein [Paenibacillus sp. NEAU-GSW1]
MTAENTAYNINKAEAYEKNTRISVPSYDSLFAMVQSYFRMQFDAKAASLLVVGAGGGNELSAWGPTNPDWSFTGVDPSEEMLSFAKHKAAELEMENRVQLIHGTVEDLPQTSSKFDAASCILVLHFIDDREEKLKLLRTIKNQLKSGAPFVLVSAYGDRNDPEFQARMNVWKSFWIEAGRERSDVDERAKTFDRLSLLPEKQIEELLAQAGFTGITRFYSTVLMAGWLCHAE